MNREHPHKQTRDTSHDGKRARLQSGKKAEEKRKAKISRKKLCGTALQRVSRVTKGKGESGSGRVERGEGGKRLIYVFRVTILLSGVNLPIATLIRTSYIQL